MSHFLTHSAFVPTSLLTRFFWSLQTLQGAFHLTNRAITAVISGGLWWAVSSGWSRMLGVWDIAYKYG